MKKCICFFICMLMMLGLASCSKAGKFDVLEVGGYDYASEANHQTDLELTVDQKNEWLADRKKTVSHFGKEYTATYDYTQVGYLYHSKVQQYTTIDNDVQVQFGINKDTGRLDSYSWVSMNYTDEITTEPKKREECLQIAKEYFSEYTKDITAYELVGERYLEIPEYSAIYDFEFRRVVDGIQTADGAFIGITIYGDVISHLFTCLDEINEVTLPSDEEMAEIESKIAEKISTIYADVKAQYSVDYSVNETSLLRMSNGK